MSCHVRAPIQELQALPSSALAFSPPESETWVQFRVTQLLHKIADIPLPPQVGATLGGRFADRAVIKGRLRREGKWVPEDRLRVTLFGSLILLPLSLVIFGLTTQFLPGKVGLVINLLCLFVNGAGVRTSTRRSLKKISLL